MKYENDRNMGEGSNSNLEGKRWDGSEYQCSQTESENGRGQQLTSSGNMYSHHASSNLEFTNSMSGSMQGSHLSLPHGSYHTPRHGVESATHLTSNSHHHHLYKHSQRTPSLCSNMTGGHGTSEVGIIPVVVGHDAAGCENAVVQLIVV